ncbi:MAG: hypothetical protein AABY22_19460, partial [Nanoarchaeota archaeon]
MLINFGKRAQVGETMTWVIATVIIILILTVFIFATSVIGKGKGVVSKKVSLIDASDNLNGKAGDFLVSKTFSAYLLTKAGDRNFYDLLNERKEIDKLKFEAENVFGLTLTRNYYFISLNLESDDR